MRCAEFVPPLKHPFAESSTVAPGARLTHAGHHEWLVVLEEGGAEALLAHVRSQAVVDHVASLRLLVVRAEERSAGAGIADLAGVRGVYEDTVPDEVLSSLEEGERLFARGWSRRRTRGLKQRRAEGLPWDAEGFQPPAPPPKQRPKPIAD